MMDSVLLRVARERLGRTLLGKWRLDSLLGIGGMAAVYAATHRNGARVAVKMLHPTLSACAPLRDRFVHEGYLANKVAHPGVVRVLDDDIDDDGAAFLVMDLVDGINLDLRLQAQLFSGEEALVVAEQVLQVLVSAHAKGIVHRDLKPDNLLIDHEGRVHVLDFGIARFLDPCELQHPTTTGAAFGTPAFISPEQALGKHECIGPRTDLYGLGATLFELVSGEHVHRSDNPQMLVVLSATQSARSVTTATHSLPQEVAAIIDRATRYDPAERFESAQSMLDEVRRARRALSLPPMSIARRELARASLLPLALSPARAPARAPGRAPVAPRRPLRRARMVSFSILAVGALSVVALAFGATTLPLRAEAASAASTSATFTSTFTSTFTPTSPSTSPSVGRARAAIAQPAAPSEPQRPSGASLSVTEASDGVGCSTAGTATLPVEARIAPKANQRPKLHAARKPIDVGY